jgi:hypothetical protein
MHPLDLLTALSSIGAWYSSSHRPHDGPLIQLTDKDRKTLETLLTVLTKPGTGSIQFCVAPNLMCSLLCHATLPRAFCGNFSIIPLPQNDCFSTPTLWCWGSNSGPHA